MRIPRRSAGVILVRAVAGSWRYLLLRAFRNWDFPKGMIEPGEDALEAALREVKEETDIDRAALVFKWGDEHTETAPYSGGKIARYYLAETDVARPRLLVSPELGRPEHDEWRWVSYAEARALVQPRLHPVLDWAERLLEQGADVQDA